MLMKILERYIAKTLILATGLSALIISGVLFLMNFLAELKNIGEGDYGFLQALIYVTMRMPSELYHYSPMLVLLGGILGLSTLTTYRELAVMRSSGFSVRQITYSVLSAAFLLTFAILLAGEFIAPKLTHVAEITKENLKNGGQAVVTASGVWLHVDNNFIHVEQVMGEHLLHGVTRYQFDGKHHLEATYYAKQLSLQQHQWIMYDAVKTTFSNDHAKSEAYASAPFGLAFNANQLTAGFVDSSAMSLPKLANFIHYRHKNGLETSQYKFEFWQRLFQPLASLTMIFLAIPFVLGALRSSSLGFRVITGIILGFMFFILNSFLGQICIVYQMPALLAALLPILLFIGLGSILSRQMIRQ